MTVLFALAAVPLMIAAGAAIDYIRIDNVRSQMQAAVDGAALAAAMAENKSNKQRSGLAETYFNSNFAPSEGGNATIAIKVNAKTVSATARYEMPNSFMALAGLNTSEITVTSEVQRAGEAWAEVALVLDYSGSMRDNDKYLRMSKAAAGMVDALKASIAENHLKVGLVPFSAMVRTTMPAKFVTQASVGATWTGCTQDRAYPNNTTVSTPSSSAATKWGYIDSGGENDSPYDCAAYSSNNLDIVPLTTDVAAVKDRLSIMSPVGNTNIPLGAEFGWNLLDPDQPFNEAAPYANKKNHKYLVLLTDGVQTSGQFGPGGARSVNQGNDNLATLCGGMKDAGITVFTVAYDVTDPAVTTLLKQCGGDRYYEPSVSEAEIQGVFEEISKEINRQIVRIAR